MVLKQVSMINTLKKGTNLTVNKNQILLLFKGSHTVTRLHRVTEYGSIHKSHVNTLVTVRKNVTPVEHAKGAGSSVPRGSQWEQR